MERRGAGRERLHVTVQWPGRPEGDDRASRKRSLRDRLQEALAPHPEVDVDWDTVSLSGQTVEAEISAEGVDATVQELEAKGLRVDAVVDTQVIQDPET